jgi:WD40 repeat protein
LWILIYFPFQVWSLSSGTLLRSIVFPSIINAIALDPAEHVFYAGSSDGNIYIAALNTERITTTNNFGKHIIGSFSNHRLSFLLQFSFLSHFVSIIFALFSLLIASVMYIV